MSEIDDVTMSVHREAGWLWIELPGRLDSGANEWRLLNRVRLAQRSLGFDDAHVAISLPGPGAITVSTAINLTMIDRMLAVRGHRIIAVLTARIAADASSRLIADLPLIGPEDSQQHAFLTQVRGHSLAGSDGWTAVDHAVATQSRPTLQLPPVQGGHP